MNEYYDWFVDYVNEHDVRVCMGDFNMAMSHIIPQCRKRGLTIDVAAWTAWKTTGGKARADSMAILFINCPGSYAPCRKEADMEYDSGGFLAEEPNDKYLSFDFATGPGYGLDKYLPKNQEFKAKCQAFLEPSQASADAVAKHREMKDLLKCKGKGKGNGRADWVPAPFKVKQKELSVEIFNGATRQHRQGAHFPLVAYTCNGCRRSPEKTAQRLEK